MSREPQMGGSERDLLIVRLREDGLIEAVDRKRIINLLEWDRDTLAEVERRLSVETLRAANERERVRRDAQRETTEALGPFTTHGADCDLGGRWRGWSPGDPDPQCQCGLLSALAAQEPK